MMVASILGLLLFSGCAAEKTQEVPAADTAATTAAAITANETVTPAAAETASNESAHVTGTWSGQIKVGQPVSMFNYVGAESGDFAPIRFRNDSEAGKKILAACSNDDLCEFTGVVEWLDEPPPPDASAIGQIIRVDSVKRVVEER